MSSPTTSASLSVTSAASSAREGSPSTSGAASSASTSPKSTAGWNRFARPGPRLRTHRIEPIETAVRHRAWRAAKGRMGREKGVTHRSTTVTHGHQRSLENRCHAGLMPIDQDIRLRVQEGSIPPSSTASENGHLPGTLQTSPTAADCPGNQQPADQVFRGGDARGCVTPIHCRMTCSPPVNTCEGRREGGRCPAGPSSKTSRPPTELGHRRHTQRSDAHHWR